MSEERPEESLQQRVRSSSAQLAPAERRVAAYLAAHPQDIIVATAESLGRATGTSNATIVRTVKALGYSGLPDLKNLVGQEVIAAVRPAHRLQQRIRAVGADAEAVIDRVFTEAGERLAETGRILDPAELDHAADLVAAAPSVLAAGVGPSTSLASYLALRLRRLGYDAHATTLSGIGMADDLLHLRSGSVIVLYVFGRVFQEVDVVVDHARSIGASVVLVAEGLAAQLRGRVDCLLEAVQSPSGLTGNSLPAHAVSDALLLAVAARDEPRATAASEALNALRTAIADEPGRSARP